MNIYLELDLKFEKEIFKAFVKTFFKNIFKNTFQKNVYHMKDMKNIKNIFKFSNEKILQFDLKFEK